MHMTKIATVSVAALLLAACGSKQPANNSTAQAAVDTNETAAPKKPPAKGTDVKVHLIWKSDVSKWKVKFDNKQDEYDPDKAVTTLAMDQGPTKFIVDVSGKNVNFQDPGGMTVWEGKPSDPKSSTPPSNPSSTQILGPEIDKNGKMVFYDLNYGDKVRIFYSIHLDNGETLDPIIDNGGGTWN